MIKGFVLCHVVSSVKHKYKKIKINKNCLTGVEEQRLCCAPIHFATPVDIWIVNKLELLNVFI